MYQNKLIPKLTYIQPFPPSSSSFFDSKSLISSSWEVFLSTFLTYLFLFRLSPPSSSWRHFSLSSILLPDTFLFSPCFKLLRAYPRQVFLSLMLSFSQLSPFQEVSALSLKNKLMRVPWLKELIPLLPPVCPESVLFPFLIYMRINYGDCIIGKSKQKIKYVFLMQDIQYVWGPTIKPS